MSYKNHRHLPFSECSPEIQRRRSEPGLESESWRTKFEPLPDITAYELALDKKYVNASEIVSSYQDYETLTFLRHRVCTISERRVDTVVAEYLGRTF